MNILKYVKMAVVVGALAGATAFMSGCGGVSDEQMAQLNDLRSNVKSLQTQTDQLKDQKASLEKDIADMNAKLQQCNKDKEETKANLQKMGSM
jgi:septal ring factor EnvC (AmiA/AmiB activator)